MLKKINLNFFSAMLLSALLFVACSDDSSSSGGDSNGIARYTAIIYGQNGGDMEFSIEGAGWTPAPSPWTQRYRRAYC